jgi:uncharacterized circularly permuted ATP-grasp superfamily protein
MMGINPPRNVYAHIVGSDLVRDDDGEATWCSKTTCARRPA